VAVEDLNVKEMMESPSNSGSALFMTPDRVKNAGYWSVVHDNDVVRFGNRVLHVE